MSRLACVDLPAFPLQLLAQVHPDWRDEPMAVVVEEKPQAFILWVNEKARQVGIRPGHRYAAALALSNRLRAGAVSEAAIREGVDALTESLRRFTPDVEPSEARWRSPGLFWLDASGLTALYASLDDWGRTVQRSLQDMGYVASVVIGFTRFGTYAVARSRRELVVFRDRDEEDSHCRRVSVSRLDLPPEVQETFIKLKIRTVAEFLCLPSKGLLRRFGPEVQALHRLAMGDLFSPLAPKPPEELLVRTTELPSPEIVAERLVFFLKRALDDLLRELDRKSLALTTLHVKLALDDRSVVEEALRPDVPTLNGPLLMSLARLRLETLTLAAGVVELTVRAEATRKTQEQLLLVEEKPRRDPQDRNRAFARLRAVFGDGAVVRASLRDGHLPTSRFEWTPLTTLPDKSSPSVPVSAPSSRALVRRIYEKPMALPHRSRHEPDGWMLRGLEFGPVRDFLGPYILSGGWWKRTVEREYYFVKMQQGDVFWVFYDRFRRRWFLEGRVE